MPSSTSTQSSTGPSARRPTAAMWCCLLALALALPASAQNKVPFLSPDEAVAKMTHGDTVEVMAFAAEPMITQPIAFCFDHRGRMLIAENRDYENRRNGFANDGGSRILILEDTDGDGQADSRKVFVEGIPFPSAIAWGFDGLWLGAPPHLLFVPDRDGDDRADTDDIEIRLTGWGIRDRHETLNSFNWGPDGWLYGCQGFATPSLVGKPEEGTKLYKKGDAFPRALPEEGVKIDGGVWRYHPTKDRFEVVAHGFSNPWGFDFDDHGQMFMTACVIPHLWHVIPGGIYHRQGGRHLNPHYYDDIKTITDHPHMSAHGGARVYLADLFPAEYRNRLFMCNIHQHQVLTDILEPKGSGYVGHHGDEFISANDKQWIGFSIEIGPGGEIYMLDWHDADICGNKVALKETGRVFRAQPKGAKIAAPGDLTKLSDADLVRAQLHPNDWHVRHARTILQERADAGKLAKGTNDMLWKLFAEQPEAPRKLRALWCLHLTGGIDAEQLIAQLDHAEPHVRGWAVQMLCEDSQASDAALEKFAAMAKDDPSPVVRLFLASALQRIELEKRWPIAENLLTHSEDAGDHNLPKMIWYGVEPLVSLDPDRALALAVKAKIPFVRKCIARRSVSGSLNAQGNRKTTDADRKEWARIIGRFAPGFTTEAVGEGGVTWMHRFRGRDAVRTHPIDRNTPCILKRDLSIPKDKSSTLWIHVSHHSHGDWKLIVRAEGKVIHETVVGSKTTEKEWLKIELDLTEFAGRNIKLELLNQPTGWKNEWAYWKKVELISK